MVPQVAALVEAAAIQAQAQAAALEQVPAAPMAVVVLAVGTRQVVLAVLVPHLHSIQVQLIPMAVVVVVALVMVTQPVSAQPAVVSQALEQVQVRPLAQISV